MGTLDERSRVEDNLISEIDIGRRNSKQHKMKFIMCLAVAVALLVTLTPASAVDRQERAWDSAQIQAKIDSCTNDCIRRAWSHLPECRHTSRVCDQECSLG